MTCLPAFLVPSVEIRADLNATASRRGERKLLVRKMDMNTERAAETVEWKAPGPGEACGVLEIRELEVAFFDHTAAQDRHRHEDATEIYIVLDGSMAIEVEGEEYRLNNGDSIVVLPGVCHKVQEGGSSFLCQVIVTNCTGRSDKHQC